MIPVMKKTVFHRAIGSMEDNRFSFYESRIMRTLPGFICHQHN